MKIILLAAALIFISAPQLLAQDDLIGGALFSWMYQPQTGECIASRNTADQNKLKKLGYIEATTPCEDVDTPIPVRLLAQCEVVDSTPGNIVRNIAIYGAFEANTDALIGMSVIGNYDDAAMTENNVILGFMPLEETRADFPNDFNTISHQVAADFTEATSKNNVTFVLGKYENFIPQWVITRKNNSKPNLTEALTTYSIQFFRENEIEWWHPKSYIFDTCVLTNDYLELAAKSQEM